MKKNIVKLTFLLCLYLLSSALFAQTIKLDPYNIITNRALYPKNIWLIDFIPGTDDIAYSEDYTVLLKKSFPSAKSETILTLEQLNTNCKELFRKIDEKEMHSIPDIQWFDKNTFRFELNSNLLAYNLTTNKADLLNSWNKEAENVDICKQNAIAAYTLENNLYISQNGTEKQITFETNPHVVMCHYVHREEFGINKGSFWSPAGNYLAFYRMDESMVTDYPIVDITTRIAESKPTKYPMAGMTSHHVTLGIYSIQTGKTVYAQTGEPAEQYLTSVTWSPDEKYVFIGLLNRGQNHLKLNMYDATSGNFVKTLFEEKSDKYVEPLDPMRFLPHSNTEFLWFSQRDGYRHLYQYNIEGKLIRQLTQGNWIVNDIIGFDSKATTLYFTASKVSPIETHCYALDLKTLKMKQLTTAEGTHSVSVSEDGKYMIDKYSSLNIPSEIDIKSTDGKQTDLLLKDEEVAKRINLPKTEIFTIKNKDGDDLYCRLIKPLNFDVSKKYPVIVYVYGGPHAQMITNSWLAGAGLFLNFLAQEGFVVFTLDNRGSANRGYAFESEVFHQLGTKEVEDQMTGIEYLKSQPYIDASRIGVHGWSFGGFMTINLMLSNPDVFKVGVAGGPVTDWKYYEVMYGERYMGTPENNPDGYKNSSVILKAGKLKGKLLIIHGGVDPVVVWQQSLAFVEACIKAQKQVDYFVYPTHEHNVRGKDRGHLHEKIYLYFKDNL